MWVSTLIFSICCCGSYRCTFDTRVVLLCWTLQSFNSLLAAVWDSTKRLTLLCTRSMFRKIRCVLARWCHRVLLILLLRQTAYSNRITRLISHKNNNRNNCCNALSCDEIPPLQSDNFYVLFSDITRWSILEDAVVPQHKLRRLNSGLLVRLKKKHCAATVVPSIKNRTHLSMNTMM